MMLQKDPLADSPTSLRVFAEQHASRQWRDFLVSLVTELDEQVDAADFIALLRRVGTRLAQTLPLPICSTLSELQAVITGVWSGMDWGVAEIREEDKFLTIIHVAYPQIPAGTDRRTTWVVPVLEGVYTNWLNGQSGETAFKARRLDTRRTDTHAIVLSYGLIAE
jgi:hypothetical protein